MKEPTNEQKNIIYSEDRRIFVSSGPGTGKTTTMIEYTKIRKYFNILYVVYNISMRNKSLEIFPPNTDVKTSGSLAYSIIGEQYRAQITNTITIEDIFKTLPYFFDKNLKDTKYIKIAYNIKKLLEQFFISLDTLEDFIVPSDLYKDFLKEYFSKIEDGTAKVTVEFLLKKLYLSNTKLNYDYIIVDEAQDSNKLFFEFINNQEANVIFIGDPNQKLYGYRGAFNIFDTYEGKVFTLMKSFRFGNNIANYANKILEMKNVNGKILGCDRESNIVTECNLPKTIISRTNYNLFENLIKYRDFKLAVNGDIKNIFSLYYDVYYLVNKDLEKIKSSFIKTIPNYKQFKNLVNHVNISEFKNAIKLWEKYGEFGIEMLNEFISHNKSYEIMLTTAHKAKGLEYLNVELDNDFSTETADEVNILYVAATRAMYQLKSDY